MSLMMELISSSLIGFHCIFFLIASTVMFDLFVYSTLTISPSLKLALAKVSSKTPICHGFTNFLVISKFATIISFQKISFTLSKALNQYSTASISFKITIKSSPL